MPRAGFGLVSGMAWEVAAPDEAAPIEGLEVGGLEPPKFVGRLLTLRGVRGLEEAREFLDPDAAPVPDARTLPGFERAVARASEAVAAGEQIAVYGDYDADGVTSTVILVEALREAGAEDCLWFVPRREHEGYGVHAGALARLADEGARLLVTADCGITAAAEIAEARGRGMEAVVLDHHQPNGPLPDAIVTGPTLAEPGHPLAEISAGGLALHFAQALLGGGNGRWPDSRWLDLAAISTIGDVVPLRGENRRIVRDGLRALARTERPGLRAMLDMAGARNGAIDAETIGFQIAPRINSAGRLGDAALAVKTLLEADPERARELAGDLNELNRERRRISDEAWQRAQEQIEQTRMEHGDVPPVVSAGDAETPAGVVGIIAGRLADRYRRPAFAYSISEGRAVGSARSQPGFDIAAALERCSDLLVRHGGHAMAAGFTVETRRLEELVERLAELAETAIFDKPGAGEAVLKIDAQVPLERVTERTAEWIDRLEPFGAGNPAPVFLSRGVRPQRVRRFGKGDGGHLGARIGEWEAVGWRMGERAAEFTGEIDVVWSFRRSRRGGRELEIRDFAPAGAASA